MLEFTLASPKQFLNDIVTLVAPGTRRVLADRRVAVAGGPSSSTLPRKRRRHDGLNSGKQAPLEW